MSQDIEDNKCIASTSTTNTQIGKESDDEMASYKKEACRVITFRIIYDLDDMNSEKVVSFKPEMSHQIFGESESIFGYRKISININLVHNSTRCYLDIKSSDQINKLDMKPDDVVKELDIWLPEGYTQNYEEFSQWFEDKEHDQIYGKLINSFMDDAPMKRFADENVIPEYRITVNNFQSQEFKEYHSRFQAYIVWFIDAANFIDLEDDRWMVFYVYEEFLHPIKKKIYRSPIGFCTVYRFYAYPKNIRARISQVFILPSHQKRGIGTALVETVLKTLRRMEEVIDVTVEEPTLTIRKIRDLEDCGIIHQELRQLHYNFFTISYKEIFDIGREKKICRKQMQRVYDVLGLYYASLNGASNYKKMLESIKKRLDQELLKESTPSKRFCRYDRIPTVSNTQSNKEELEVEFKRYCEDIEPSVKYLEAKLIPWTQKVLNKIYSDSN